MDTRLNTFLCCKKECRITADIPRNTAPATFLEHVETNFSLRVSVLLILYILLAIFQPNFCQIQKATLKTWIHDWTLSNVARKNAGLPRRNPTTHIPGTRRNQCFLTCLGFPHSIPQLFQPIFLSKATLVGAKERVRSQRSAKFSPTTRH